MISKKNAKKSILIKVCFTDIIDYFTKSFFRQIFVPYEKGDANKHQRVTIKDFSESKLEFNLLSDDLTVKEEDRNELSIQCVNCNTDNNAIIAIAKFIKYKFTPLDIGYQTNLCQAVES